MIQEKEFESSLPMERKLFYELFDFLNDKSETTECKHDFSLTKEFLKDKNIEAQRNADVFNNDIIIKRGNKMRVPTYH